MGAPSIDHVDGGRLCNVLFLSALANNDSLSERADQRVSGCDSCNRVDFLCWLHRLCRRACDGSMDHDARKILSELAGLAHCAGGIRSLHDQSVESSARLFPESSHSGQFGCIGVCLAVLAGLLLADIAVRACAHGINDLSAASLRD